MNRMHRIASLTALTAAAALALAGCASQAEPEATAEAPLAIHDPWLKATEGEMTGVFAEIENTTDSELVIESAEVDGAGMTELHETVVQSDGSSQMQEMTGGLTVPAGGTVVLQPGGNHIMAMGLTEAILPGDEVGVTLTLANGTEVSFTAVAKEYTGAEETYAPEDEHSDSAEHSDSDSAEHEHH